MTQDSQPSVLELRLALVITAVLLTGLVAFEAVTHRAINDDFNSIYTCAWILWHGDAGKIYDFEEQSKAQMQVFQRPEINPLIHPPFEPIFFSAFARIPYGAAYF